MLLSSFSFTLLIDMMSHFPAAAPPHKHLPSPSHSHSHCNSRRGSDASSADAEGDQDAEGDADADADADAELLEAVHAAENRSTSMKAEDGENDD